MPISFFTLAVATACTDELAPLEGGSKSPSVLTGRIVWQRHGTALNRGSGWHEVQMPGLPGRVAFRKAASYPSKPQFPHFQTSNDIFSSQRFENEECENIL